MEQEKLGVRKMCSFTAVVSLFLKKHSYEVKSHSFDVINKTA